MSESSALFQPNNHSAWEVLWTNASDEQAMEVKALLEQSYGFRVVGDVQKVGAWEVRSHNFRVDVERNGERRTVLVKKNIAWKNADDLGLVERVLDFLREQRIPVPTVILATDGSAHVSFENHVWQVFAFIPGNYFRGTEEELREAATHIARLHKALFTIPFVEEIAKRVKAVKVWTRGDFENHFSNTDMQGNVAFQAVMAERTFLEEQMADVEREAEAMKMAHRQVVRNSLHPHDTLFENGKLQAIIDFEEIGVNELGRDVGNACHRFVRQYVVNQERPWQETLDRGVEIFMDAYLAANPLPPTEIKLTPFFIKDELLRKLHSTLTKLPTAEDKKKYEQETFKFIALLHEAAEVGKRID